MRRNHGSHSELADSSPGVKLSPWESIHLRSICYFKANYFGNPPNHTAKMLWIPQKGSYTSPNSPALSDSQILPCPQHLVHPKSSTAHAVPSRLAVVARPHRRRRSLANMPREMGPNYPRFFFRSVRSRKKRSATMLISASPKHMLLGDLPHVNDNTSDNTSWRDLIPPVLGRQFLTQIGKIMYPLVI